MAKISGVVYDPPTAGLPHIAVVLHEGEVLTARACPSIAEAERFLSGITPAIQAKLDEMDEQRIKLKITNGQLPTNRSV